MRELSVILELKTLKMATPGVRPSFSDGRERAGSGNQESPAGGHCRLSRRHCGAGRSVSGKGHWGVTQRNTLQGSAYMTHAFVNRLSCPVCALNLWSTHRWPVSPSVWSVVAFLPWDLSVSEDRSLPTHLAFQKACLPGCTGHYTCWAVEILIRQGGSPLVQYVLFQWGRTALWPHTQIYPNAALLLFWKVCVLWRFFEIGSSHHALRTEPISQRAL